MFIFIVQSAKHFNRLMQLALMYQKEKENKYALEKGISLFPIQCFIILLIMEKFIP